MDVLNRQARVGLIKPDRSAARRRRKVDELLEVLSAWRGRRVLGELEDEVEDLSDVLREIGDVLVEGAVIHGEETNLVVLERHKLREVWRADGVEVFRRSSPSRAQEQLDLDEGKARFDGQDHQEWALFAGARDVSGGRQGSDLLGGHVR